MAMTIQDPASSYAITDAGGASLAPAMAIKTITTSGDGYFEDFVSTTTSYATVSFGSVSAPGFMVIRNEDATDNVIVAVGTASNEEDVAELEPGQKFQTRLPASQTVRIKSSANTPRARVFACAR